MGMSGPGEFPAPRLPSHHARVYTRLDALPADVRRDFAALLRVAVRESPRRWSRTGGVQDLWLTLPEAASGGDDDEVLVQRPARGSLLGYRYADDIDTASAFHADVDRQLPGNRSVALV
jgi:hypothetical protein